MVRHKSEPSANGLQFTAARGVQRLDICHRMPVYLRQSEAMIDTAPRAASPQAPPHLTTTRGAALYIGALLGPGLLLLPGLAVAVAGPASLLAWIALLVLSALFAVVFAAFGLRFPSAGGVIGYVSAGLGPRAGLVAGWVFLPGGVAGAPGACL